MPKIYRSMLADANGTMPKIGCDGGPGLGVRIPPDPNSDVRPDASGIVGPGAGGMSVAPSVAKLLPHLIPVRLKPKYPYANASNKKIIWSFGDGPFIADRVSQSLNLRIDPNNRNHGLVEPNIRMPLSEFENALAQTQNGWMKDEE